MYLAFISGFIVDSPASWLIANITSSSALRFLLVYNSSKCSKAISDQLEGYSYLLKCAAIKRSEFDMSTLRI
jgi:hypothetical protein